MLDMEEMFELGFEGEEWKDDLPYSFRDSISLLFRLSLRGDVRRMHESQVSQGLINGKPAWANEQLAITAVYDLARAYYKGYGGIGLLNPHPADTIDERNRESFRFYVDVQSDFLNIRDPDSIYEDLCQEILNLLRIFRNTGELCRYSDNVVAETRRLIQDQIFDLNDGEASYG